MELSEVIEGIQSWIRMVQENYRGKINIEFLVENENFLRYIIENENYIAELVVEPEGFHPHRFVWFEALDKTKDLALQEPYFYMDKKEDYMENILENINKGILYILETQ